MSAKLKCRNQSAESRNETSSQMYFSLFDTVTADFRFQFYTEVHTSGVLDWYQHRYWPYLMDQISAMMAFIYIKYVFFCQFHYKFSVSSEFTF